jgi:hypothetical protein
MAPGIDGGQSLAVGRLTYLAWKGRGVLNSGAARCLKLIGKLQPPDQPSNRQIK